MSASGQRAVTHLHLQQREDQHVCTLACHCNLCTLLLAASVGQRGRQVIPANDWPLKRRLSPSAATG